MALNYIDNLTRAAGDVCSGIFPSRNRSPTVSTIVSGRCPEISGPTARSRAAKRATNQRREIWLRTRINILKWGTRILCTCANDRDCDRGQKPFCRRYAYRANRFGSHSPWRRGMFSKLTVTIDTRICGRFGPGSLFKQVPLIKPPSCELLD